MITTADLNRRLTEVPELIPARMLNEFAYCPRLAYLEWVQAEFSDNLETRQGRFCHRRVDRPSCKTVEGPDEVKTSGRKNGQDGECADSKGPHPGPLPEGEGEHEKIHTRSLMLSAPGEGLIAKMDLVDIDAATAVPVDYKRGRVPDLPEKAWEPERVQLCAQGLILREGGYHCEGGILYYCESRRRVSIPFDDELVERTRELIRQMREMAITGILPPPLEDSPKCPRCSLVGICLPDETRFFDHDARPARHAVRRLLPARDDALPLYLQEQGTTLGKSGEELVVKQRRDVLQKIRLIDVSQVCLLGNIQVTTQALQELSTRGIPLCYFSYGGWFHAMTQGLVHKNVELRLRQFETATDAARSLALARQFVLGKIKNGRTLLRRHLAKHSGEADSVSLETVSEAADRTESPQPLAAPGNGQKASRRRILEELDDLGRKAARATSAESLLGLEGMAAKVYFAGFAKLLAGDAAFDMAGRNRRPPRDPVNALLSLLYAMLIKELTVTLQAVGFDPMLGFYHRPRYGKPSLALDMAEPFRPLVADSVAMTLINNGEVSGSSFLHRAGAVALTDAGRRAVIAAYERRMDTLVTHPIFGYRVSYRRILEVQSRLLARTLLGEISEYPCFCTR